MDLRLVLVSSVLLAAASRRLRRPAILVGSLAAAFMVASGGDADRGWNDSISQLPSDGRKS